MPEANGFELFNSVNKEFFEVVFTTAYAQYVEKAIKEIGCFGYLLKPFEQQKLRLIFERYSQKADQSKHLKFINGSQNKRTMVHLNDVIFCKAENNYCELHLKNSKYLLSKTLGSLEKRLPKNMFKRVHRSYIVNLNYINHFNKLKNELHLNHENELLENEIPVSAKYKEEIVNLFL